MNGTLFTVTQYEDCLHQDIVFRVDDRLYKVICNCGHTNNIDSTVREVLTCAKHYPWLPSETIILIEHIREYFYAGHESLVYREGIIQEEIEKALFL